jgi:formyltetrahydrofolate deformylase
MFTYILSIEGKDAKGLIYNVTHVLYQFKCNITNQDEYVTPNGRFYMRTEFESDEVKDLLVIKNALDAQLRSTDLVIRIHERSKKNIVILVTKEHHCLSELLVRHHFDELNANIIAVFGNHEVLRSYVEKFDLPFITISHEGKSREQHESEVAEALNNYDADYIVLAKYMRILSPAFVEKFQGKLINIHHSFLPAFIGANPYKQAHERGVKIIGATAHYVNSELDQGPIICQDVIQVDHKHSAKDMARVGKDIEKMVLFKALQLVFDDKVFISENRTVIL